MKIDSWFGDRWYGFAGKFLGIAGVHSERNLRVPPFHPHRVIAEARFRLVDPPGPVSFREPLHRPRSSESNLNNSIVRIDSSMTVGWFSGSTASNGSGSIMAYSSTAHGAVGWYAGLELRQEWSLMKLIGADARQWETILTRTSGSQS